MAAVHVHGERLSRFAGRGIRCCPRYRANAARLGEDGQERRRLLGVGLMLGAAEIRRWVRRSRNPPIAAETPRRVSLRSTHPTKATLLFLSAAPFPAASLRRRRPALPA